MAIFFDHRTDAGTKTSSDPAEAFSDWRGSEESWLFLAPHDDDIMIACGLTFLAGLTLGVKMTAGIVTNGRMGYCRPEMKDKIVEVRQKECTESFARIGLKAEDLHFFGFDDCSLNVLSGRRFAQPGDPCAIAGGTGVTNSMVWLMRKARPNRLFIPTGTDLHPDHKAVNQEAIISIFHAQGSIWPELGEPIPDIPQIYEFAAYSNFATPPTLRVRTSEDLFEKKINAIYAYQSQEQIDLTVATQKRAGANEYLREVVFDIFDPDVCATYF